MQSTSWEMLQWMSYKLESRLPGAISTTSIKKSQQISTNQEISTTTNICRWYHSNGRNWRATKGPLNEGERGEWKRWLKTQHSKTYTMASGPITSCQIDRKKVETVADFLFLVSKITVDSDCSHEIKRCLLLGRKVMTSLDSILKSETSLWRKVLLVKAMVFPVVVYNVRVGP